MAEAPESASRASIAALAEFNRHTAKTHSGIWRDLAVRKRRTEVDPQIGTIAELGREAGVETPAIRALVELIHDVEDGRRAQSFDTLKVLIDRCQQPSPAASRW
jgi:2-dehydropantoate 2-reductase